MPADDNSEHVTPQDPQDATPNSRRKGALALAALILLLLVTCCGIGLSMMNDVPDVIGMTEDEARAALEEAGFEVTVETATDGEGADGDESRVVTAQSPEPGRRFVRGTRVRLTLSPSASTAEGSGGAAAGGSTSTPGDAAESFLPPPAGGDSGSGAGYTVTSGVSSGAADRRPVIPMVGNTTAASATATLQGAGYRVAVKYGPSSAGIVEGNVYAQEPAFGSRADRGSLVTIWVSTGAPHEDGYEGIPYPGPGY